LSQSIDWRGRQHAPDLYSGLIAGMPFVDVLNTMLDDKLPLTAPERFRHRPQRAALGEKFHLARDIGRP
jgi:hypothetical protein